MAQRTVRRAITAAALAAALAGTGAAHAAGPGSWGSREGGLWGWLVEIWEVVGGGGVETVAGRAAGDQEDGGTAGTTGPSPGEGVEPEREDTMNKADKGFGIDPDG